MRKYKLSDCERLNLANQFRVLDSLAKEGKIEDDRDFDQLIRILESGYTEHYDKVFQGIREEVSADTQQFMLDVVELHTAIHRDDENPANVELDSNEAALEIWFAKFLQGRLSDYEDATEYRSIRIVSGVGPKLDYYRRMVAAWYKLAEPGRRPPLHLTPEQIKQIKDEANYKNKSLV